MEGAIKKKASEKNTSTAFETLKKEIASLCINSLTVYRCKKFYLNIKSKTILSENQAPGSSLIFCLSYSLKSTELPYGGQ